MALWNVTWTTVAHKSTSYISGITEEFKSCGDQFWLPVQNLVAKSYDSVD